LCLALTPDPSPRGRGGDGETVGEARRMAGEARERDGSGRARRAVDAVGVSPDFPGTWIGTELALSPGTSGNWPIL